MSASLRFHLIVSRFKAERIYNCFLRLFHFSVSNHVPDSSGKSSGASVVHLGCGSKKLQKKNLVEIEIEHFNHSRCYLPIFTINDWTNSNLAHKLIPLMQLCIQSIFIKFRNSLLAKNSISILNVFPILCNLPSNSQLFHPFRIESFSPYNTLQSNRQCAVHLKCNFNPIWLHYYLDAELE